jgi:predicted transcriptional regulator
MVKLVGKKNRKEMMSMQESETNKIEEIKENAGFDDKTMSVSDLNLLKFYGPRIL